MKISRRSLPADKISQLVILQIKTSLWVVLAGSDFPKSSSHSLAGSEFQKSSCHSLAGSDSDFPMKRQVPCLETGSILSGEHWLRCLTLIALPCWAIEGDSESGFPSHLAVYVILVSTVLGQWNMSWGICELVCQFFHCHLFLRDPVTKPGWHDGSVLAP